MARDAARAHVTKAEEYLDAARIVLDHEYCNATCSLAVISGINAKDAICILSVGFTGKSDDHARAAAELRQSGAIGARLAPTLSRLLSVKAKSQYSAPSVTAADASDAVKRAERLITAARELLTSTPG